MQKTAEKRAGLLRQAAADGRSAPDDLFGMRMAVHEAFEGTGADSSRVCALLLSSRPPISEWDCCRLEMVASQIDLEPGALADRLFGLCEMVRLVTPD